MKLGLYFLEFLARRQREKEKEGRREGESERDGALKLSLQFLELLASKRER